MISTKQELALEVIRIAENSGVPAALVCSIIEVSSRWDASLHEWNPTRWLLMQNPVDLGGDKNWLAMGTRWGLMQVLGQEAFMAGWKDLSALKTSHGSLEAGCKLLKRFLDEQKDERKALLVWFGAERRGLAYKALAVLPEYEKFVEARPCVST